jgi:hypothetical protein
MGSGERCSTLKSMGLHERAPAPIITDPERPPLDLVEAIHWSSDQQDRAPHSNNTLSVTPAIKPDYWCNSLHQSLHLFLGVITSVMVFVMVGVMLGVMLGVMHVH